MKKERGLVKIPTEWYIGTCLILSVLISFASFFTRLNPTWLAAEVFGTILVLFVFGSIRYRIDKNVVTYGALPVVLATFFPIWWPISQLREEITHRGFPALWESIQQTLFSIHGLEKLIHGDTMLFILGLTFFVSVISQTRLLETISMNILRIFEGRVLPTVLVIAGIVAFASGILDGVSMIGLTIRVLTIILVMAKLSYGAIEFIIMSSVVLTTVCGMWLAYGEPPNLIMKSNLHLDDAFFLRYTLPMAVASFLVVAMFLQRWLKGKMIPLRELDVLEVNTADIRFLQAVRQGEVREAEEMLQKYAPHLGNKIVAVESLYHRGYHPISSLLRAGVEGKTVRTFIQEYLGEEFVEPVLSYYRHQIQQDQPQSLEKQMIEADVIERLLRDARLQKQAAQTWGKLAFIPFIGLLFWHANNHQVPLFIASFAGFIFAFLGIAAHSKMRGLVLREATHEYKEYLFLFPLFLSITLLSAMGFFNQLKEFVEGGVEVLGRGHIAVIQFIGFGFLSAILDNNVVADFASRAIEGMQDMFLFATAQIAGYAAGGCLTHIGSAQSVVAFAFILRNLDSHFTPFTWVRAMWKMILTISIVFIGWLYLETWLMEQRIG